jgi:hypothetical protein
MQKVSGSIPLGSTNLFFTPDFCGACSFRRRWCPCVAEDNASGFEIAVPRTYTFVMRHGPKSSLRRNAAFAGVAIAGLCSVSAFAQSSDASRDLPGVEGDFRIVRPRAEVLEPEPDTPPDDGTLKVGDWDVKISGSLTVDIGTMKPRSGR